MATRIRSCVRAVGCRLGVSARKPAKERHSSPPSSPRPHRAIHSWLAGYGTARMQLWYPGNGTEQRGGTIDYNQAAGRAPHAAPLPCIQPGGVSRPCQTARADAPHPADRLTVGQSGRRNTAALAALAGAAADAALTIQLTRPKPTLPGAAGCAGGTSGGEGGGARGLWWRGRDANAHKATRATWPLAAAAAVLRAVPKPPPNSG